MRSGQVESTPHDHEDVAETRAHPRYAVEIDAEVLVGERRIPARTKNISRGGIAMTADSALAIGATVTVSLALVFDEAAKSEPLPVQGRVVWCSPLHKESYQLGVMFVGVRSEERSYVDMFIRYLKE
jgi:hypothetical protein